MQVELSVSIIVEAMEDVTMENVSVTLSGQVRTAPPVSVLYSAVVMEVMEVDTVTVTRAGKERNAM